jgi:glutamate carboxypeptidase
MSGDRSIMDWIDSRHAWMVERVQAWSRINSGSYHLEGLARMCTALQEDFAVLDADMELLDCDPIIQIDAAGEEETVVLGQALHLVKRPQAAVKVFLGGHMDTVFGKDHPFQTPRRLDAKPIERAGRGGSQRWAGGAADRLAGFERSPLASRLGWEVLINPDEEIGSPGSARLIEACARRNHLGLLYEPALADGTLAGARKGSGHFYVVVRGRAAHAGREFEQGRNAIVALADYTQALYALNGRRNGVTINPGRVEGGGALNMVPDLAILRFSVRIGTPADRQWLEARLDRLDRRFGRRDGIRIERRGAFGRPPKIISAANQRLFAVVTDCGRMLDIPIAWQATGGVCDGNNLAAAGLPNVDTMGVRGAAIHSEREYVILDSLTERAKLSALLLMRLAAGEVRIDADTDDTTGNP